MPSLRAAAAALAVVLAAPASAHADVAYVNDQAAQRIVPVDLATGGTLTPIPIHGNAMHLSRSPDGKWLWAPLSNSGELISTDTDAARQVTGLNSAAGGQFTPDDATLWSVNSYGGAGIAKVDVATAALTATTFTVGGGVGLNSPSALSPDGRTLYVFGGFNLYAVDTATGAASAPIPMGGLAQGMVLSADGRTLYVAAGSTVTPVDTATWTAGTPRSLGSNPYGLAISPDGRTLFAAIRSTSTNYLARVDLQSGLVEPPVTIGTQTYTQGVAVSPDGSTAWVVNNNKGTIQPVDVATGTLGAAITVGGRPSDIAIVAKTRTAPTISVSQPFTQGVDGDPTNPTVSLNVAQGGVDPSQLKVGLVNSTDRSVVDAGDVGFSGAGATRTVTFDPHGVGETTLTFQVTGPDGQTATVTTDYAASGATSPTSRALMGESDSSTAIDAGDGYMLVGDDELSTIGLYIAATCRARP